MDWQRLLDSYLFDIICYIVGLVSGIILLFLIYRLALLINKIANKYRKESVRCEVDQNLINDIIDNACNNFTSNYGNKKISIRLKMTKQIITSLIEEIAFQYYPLSKEPLTEITIKELLYLYDDVNLKINQLVNDVFDSPSFKFLFQAYKVSHNTISFFKRKNDLITEKNIRKLKLSTIYQVVSSKMNDNNKADDQTYFIFNNYLNNKITNLIKEIGLEANKVFTKEIYQEKEKMI